MTKLWQPCGAVSKMQSLMPMVRLLELRTAAAYSEGIHRHPSVLDPHDKSKTIRKHSTHPVLHAIVGFAARRSTGHGAGGGFGFDIVPLIEDPAWKRGESRRRVGRHIVRITEKDWYVDRSPYQVAVRQNL